MWMRLIFAGAMAMVMNTAAQAADMDADIKQVLENYWKAADSRDAEILDQVMHDEYKVIALTAEGLRAIAKADYLALIEAGKIGGNPRKFEVLDMDVQGEMATSRVRMTGEAAAFHDTITLARTEAGWKMLSNVTEVKPR